MLSGMRLVVVVLGLSACVSRYPTTRVTLFDPSELTVAAGGKPPEKPPRLLEGDIALPGRSADVLAFDGDKLEMHAIVGCGYRRHCTPLELRLDTPLANVRTIRQVDVASHEVIPLGLLVGSIFTAIGGGMLAYDHYDHDPLFGGSTTPNLIALGVGLTILALEIHARLASDTVIVVR